MADREQARRGRSRQPMQVELFRALFNDFARSSEGDIDLLSLNFFIEGVIRDPADEEAWKRELSPCEDLGDISPESRVFVSAIVHTRGKDVAFLTNLYIDADRNVTLENTLPFEIPNTSLEKFEERTVWQIAQAQVIRMSPMLWRMFQYFLKTREAANG